MRETFKALCNLLGSSGNEKEVRAYIIHQLEQIPNVTWKVDNLGNLLVEKKGKKLAPHKLMLSAHMDEVGLIITYINEDGSLNFDCVGGVDPSVCIGRQVLVGEKHLPGVIGAKPIHLLDKDERKALPKMKNLTIDLGVTTKADAEALVSLGDYAYFLPEFLELGTKRFTSKAVDDRVGCALLLDLLRQENEYDLTVAFVVQEEIGLRGATVAAYTVAPEFSIVLEATTAADLEDATGDACVCVLGKGPVISFMDRSTIYDRTLYQLAGKLCEEHGMCWQTKSRIAGGNDAGAIHKSRGGVRTLAISLPCRYIHSPASVAQWSDLEQMQKLLPLLITAIQEGKAEEN